VRCECADGHDIGTGEAGHSPRPRQLRSCGNWVLCPRNSSR
jgi:hypothetical protein